MIETIFRATAAAAAATATATAAAAAATATAAEQAADELREIIFDKAKKNSPA